MVAKGSLPAELEQVVLLALAGFDEDASGREVYDVVTDMTGRDVAVAAIHITLARLHEKGWATRRSLDPEPGRGGKQRRRYSISQAGARALTEQRSQLERLWGRASAHPLLRSQER